MVDLPKKEIKEKVSQGILYHKVMAKGDSFINFQHNKKAEEIVKAAKFLGPAASVEGVNASLIKAYEEVKID